MVAFADDDRAIASRSVATKLINDLMKCDDGNLEAVVHHLQLGCLMGRLTHLSLSGLATFKICVLDKRFGDKYALNYVLNI
jgi:hypothetical protein